jgi:hypothetical protein
MSKCPVPECEQEFKNNSGLSSHMAMAHNLLRNGEPLPPEAIAKRKENIKASQLKRRADGGWHSPEARKKAKVAIKASYAKKKKLNTAIDRATVNVSSDKAARHYAALAQQGIFRCPECMQSLHRKIDFPTATELGKHRRFKHGVLGRNHLKAQVALERRQEQRIEQRPTGVIVNPNVAVNSNGRIQCPQCPNTFKGLNFLAAHLKRKHQIDPSGLQILPATTQELIHANGSTQRTAAHTVHAVNGHSNSNDAAYVEAIAVSNLTGKLQGIILAASDEYDIAPRQLARRCILALSEHYST